jgi:acetylornithine deacetylase/succinyl-diaminopimelate desuccinylase-like protein
MDADSTRRFVNGQWRESIVPALVKYVEIPAQSPAFDPSWQSNGHIERAVTLIADWIRSQNVRGLSLDVVRLPGRTPVLLADVAGDSTGAVLLYGHLDKQPPFEGWRPHLGAWKPVIEDDKLYGRGAADDGYSAFAAVTAIKALQRENVPCARCVVLIEACEESGSYDLPRYIEALKSKIGSPSLVICLDSGCGDYERLWLTSSLRGLVTVDLTASTLTEGVHSGAASGIVPSSFRVLRQLLSRLEDEKTGQIIPPTLHVDIPAERAQQARTTAEVLGAAAYESFPFELGARPVTDDVYQLLLNRTWRPQLEVTGAAGIPPLDKAGNVLRPSTTLRLSLRLPPTLDAGTAVNTLRALFEQSPPYGAKIVLSSEQATSGWNAPALASWLHDSTQRASRGFFGKDACFMGEGGSIPFMTMLAERFPQAQFVITGVLGPHSNAHGPNEFLHLPTATKLTACIARILADHCSATRTES